MLLLPCSIGHSLFQGSMGEDSTVCAYQEVGSLDPFYTSVILQLYPKDTCNFRVAYLLFSDRGVLL